MPIFIDSRASEINIDGKRVDGLEALTGSDLMISRLKMPAANKTLILRHISEGALLVQVKIGDDLASSIGDRLNESIARMTECYARQCQSVLLFVGVLTGDGDGKALINGRHTHMKHETREVQRAISKWRLRGGTFESLSREGMLADWCEDQLTLLEMCYREPTKLVYQVGQYPDDPPKSDDPMQLPIRVTDARRTIFSIRGWGYEKTERLWSHCGTGIACLHFITNPANAGVIEGIGKTMIQNARDYFGMKEGDSIWLKNEVDAIASKAVAANRKLSAGERKAKAAMDTMEIFGKGKR